MKKDIFVKLASNRFLFEELVKRDFKAKYKRTVLGMAWSIMAPLAHLLIMAVVFTRFFGANIPHYIIFIFSGNIIFSFFSESTKGGMGSILGNAPILTKINIPKYLFLMAKNVQSFVNFALILLVYFIFVAVDGIPFTWKFVCLLYPIVCLLLFNIGIGMVLSACYVFFRDTQYLYDIFTQILMYASAVFYTVDRYSPFAQNLFLLNPIYLFIRYFRKIVIDSIVPSGWFHLLMAVDVVIALSAGCWMYKKYNTKFLYYL